MLVQIEKKRIEFGPPREIYVYRCDECGREHRIVKRWRGSPPPGGIRCDCGSTILFSGKTLSV